MSFYSPRSSHSDRLSRSNSLSYSRDRSCLDSLDSISYDSDDMDNTEENKNEKCVKRWDGWDWAMFIIIIILLVVLIVLVFIMYHRYNKKEVAYVATQPIHQPVVPTEVYVHANEAAEPFRSQGISVGSLPDPIDTQSMRLDQSLNVADLPEGVSVVDTSMTELPTELPSVEVPDVIPEGAIEPVDLPPVYQSVSTTTLPKIPNASLPSPGNVTVASAQRISPVSSKVYNVQEIRGFE